MKKYFLLILVSLTTKIMVAQDGLFLTTNKNAYVAGEQVRFDLIRFNENLIYEEEDYLATVDIVAPSGMIIQSKSLIKDQNGKYFFALSDTLATGIYRLVANTADATESMKRIHVYGLDETSSMPSTATDLRVEFHGGLFATGAYNKLFVHVTNQHGVGMETTGTLVNSADSVIQYLTTDVNGVASAEFTVNDSLYHIRFGRQSQILKPRSAEFSVSLTIEPGVIKLKQDTTSASDSLASLLVNGNVINEFDKSSKNEILIPTKNWNAGIHKVTVLSAKKTKQEFIVLVKPDKGNQIELNSMQLSNNEFAEFFVEDQTDEMSHLSISIVDESQPYNFELDFYEEYFFDQSGLDLQLVDNRDFEAYLNLFHQSVKKTANNERLNFEPLGVLAFKAQDPYNHISVMDLNTLESVDEMNGDLRGIHNIEEQLPKKTRVLSYHFSSFILPKDMANLTEVPAYQYQPIKTQLSIGEDERNLIQQFELQKNILLSYSNHEKGDPELPQPDATYFVENYEVPNTTTELVNYIVKYVTVIGKQDAPRFSMYRHNSSYKYSGTPLVFINNLPIYDARTALNLSPKDISRIEVRNSNPANEHFGNFALNGSISFYLKDGVKNPLELAYSNLPSLEPYQEFSWATVESEHAPDFRHQLFWNSVIRKNNDTFWVDFKCSDLSTVYNIHLTAFMKNGNVIQTQSKVVVK